MKKIVTLQLQVRVDRTVPPEYVAEAIGRAIDPDGWAWDVSYPEVVKVVTLGLVPPK